jgi:hypothetical protein
MLDGRYTLAARLYLLASEHCLTPEGRKVLVEHADDALRLAAQMKAAS